MCNTKYRELETVVYCHPHRQVHAKEPTVLGLMRCSEYDWRSLYVKALEDNASSHQETAT